MAQCKKCKNLKSRDKFHKNKSRNNGLDHYCIECRNAYDKFRYRKNWKHIRELKNIRNTKTKLEMRIMVYKYLLQHPCKCGESNPATLDFDHIRGKKKYNVANMLSGIFSNKSVMNEIKKCQVLCSNCHRKKTAKQQHWYSKVIQAIVKEKVHG